MTGPVLPHEGPGVLPAQDIRSAVGEGFIVSDTYKIPDRNVQPASLDLRLGERAYRLRCSFLPETEGVDNKLSRYRMGELDLRDGAILERNRPYLIPLIEGVALPPWLRGRTNPKSSTGRLDIFTRVITDRSHQFDDIAPGHTGRLYLEVVSRTFTVQVRTGLALNQLRLLAGDGATGDDAMRVRHASQPILYYQGDAVPLETMTLRNGLFLSLDLDSANSKVVGYRAKKNSQLLDLSLSNYYNPADFWEPVHPERGGRLILEPEEFYLLVSLEGVSIPPDLAAEMTAYDPTSGELRTHYAGFFDPGFGFQPEGEDMEASHGSRAVLEVRAHDVPFMVEHGQRVCKLVFERMARPPDILYGEAIGSSYQDQTCVLSRHFRVGTGREAAQLQLDVNSSTRAAPGRNRRQQRLAV